MQFVYPAFLFALVSLAVPVVVHLFNFRRYQKVQFSNVQFLKELQEQQASRRNLRERLILASRLLALFFLVLAFARPFIPHDNNTDIGKEKVISIFVDNSYSMHNPGVDGTLLDQARQKAREIAAAYNINDRFQLLTQDFEGKHQRLLSRDEFNNAVDAVQITTQSRSLQQIVDRQLSLLNEQHGVRKDMYIISDFQRSMAAQKVQADTAVEVNLIQLRSQSLPNVAVDSVWLLSAVHRVGGSERLVVRLHNYADKPAVNIPMKLFINGSQKALASFTIDAGAVVTDTLAFSGLQAGWQRGEIQVQDNPITFDNNFWFTYNVARQLPVLLIDGGSEDPFLKAVFASDAFFKTTRMPEGNVDYAGMDAYPLIVLSNIPALSQGLARQLSEYVKGGGTLVLFPPDDNAQQGYNAFLQLLGVATYANINTQTVKVTGINQQNMLFRDVFDAIPQNPDMPVVKKYYSINQSGGEEPIMQLSGRRTFWSGYNAGKGRLYLSAVPLNDDFSNLQRHGLFVPVMFRIALLSGHDAPLFYTLGKNESIETVPLRATEKQVISLNKGNMSIIPDVRQQNGSTRLFVADQLREAGLYDLKKQDSTAAVLAFNDSRAESDMKYLSSSELKNIIPGNDSRVINEKQPAGKVINETNNGLQLWKLCIILTLIFLAVEILLVRYFKTGNKLAGQA
ncbi:VWA domain-containing protein [Mucilaginibacter limnophilus]|uniref:VWA domain-containing protein n=1 Tax=Mucilaginibacter limnophilus TaxID=1932778 RepID=A0A3S2Y3P0_9SPHI|nr:BatA domain-containing protein [Mucilaginibacter limnophilus]RVU02795.1 VWA domain-containing protein [Mucilaginibacter limnophilus]